MVPLHKRHCWASPSCRRPSHQPTTTALRLGDAAARTLRKGFQPYPPQKRCLCLGKTLGRLAEVHPRLDVFRSAKPQVCSTWHLLCLPAARVVVSSLWELQIFVKIIFYSEKKKCFVALLKENGWDLSARMAKCCPDMRLVRSPEMVHRMQTQLIGPKKVSSVGLPLQLFHKCSNSSLYITFRLKKQKQTTKPVIWLWDFSLCTKTLTFYCRWH